MKRENQFPVLLIIIPVNYRNMKAVMKKNQPENSTSTETKYEKPIPFKKWDAYNKAFDDGEPSTLELYVVPSFGGDSRIGESFIFADGGAIKDVVLEDRASLRADRASFTLAHELGHVLLDQPGHPDDFGLDTPTRLMDADAVNASAFGPRRLTIAECERVVRQSGPSSPPRLLSAWPTTRGGAASR